MTILTRIELAFGADLTANPATWTWTDVSVYALGSVSVTPGRADNVTETAPTRCTFRLKNTDGRFSPRLPSSPYYPNVRRQTPVRVSMNPGTGYVQRFQGYIDVITPSWPGGNSDYAEVAVTASGSLRRLGQGASALRSAMARSIPVTTGATLRQYWPLEDRAGALQAASGLLGGAPLAASGVTHFGQFDLSGTGMGIANNIQFGTDKLPNFRDGGSLTGTFPAGSASAWTVQLTERIDLSAGGAAVTVLEWACPGSTYPRWQLIYDYTPPAVGVNAIRVMAIDGSGAATQVAAYGFRIDIGEWRIDVAQSGGNIAVTLTLIRADNSSVTASGTLTTATLAGIAGITINPHSDTLAADYVVGQLRIWDGNSAPNFYSTSWTSYNGESVTDRLTRLCAESGVPLTITGTSTTTMGPQGVDTFPNLLRECETADIGILYDGFGPGLSYLTRPARYSQPVSMALDTKRQQVKLPFTPTEDDQRIRNDWTVSRKGGSSVHVTDPVHIAANGLYDSSVTTNIAGDAGLLNQASWRVHLGTVDEMRVPGLSLQLIDRPELWAAWLATTLGKRLTVANLPAQYPPGILDMIVEGYTETWDSSSWKVDLNTSPTRPWIVGALNTSLRLELAGQTLAANLVPGATTLSLATAAGHQLFTLKATYPNDFPPNNECILGVAGWPIRVINATGAGSPQTLTIDPSPNASTIPAGTPVTLWRPAALAL